MIGQFLAEIRRGRAYRAGRLLMLACILMLLGAVPSRAYDPTALVNYNKANAYIFPTGYWNLNSTANPFGRFGDDAGFQSQALIAAGIDLTRGLDDLYDEDVTYGGKTYTGYYDDYDYLVRIQNPNGRITCVTAYDVTMFLLDYEGWSYEWFSTAYPLLPYFEVGDLVYFIYNDPKRISPDGWQMHIAAIVGTTKDRLGQTIPMMAGHSPNTSGEPITNYFGTNNRYGFDLAYVLRNNSAAHQGTPVEVSGGLHYNGPEALTLTIYEKGHEYLGFILNNSDNSCQDEVIATTTTALAVGTHLVRGFCCNETKGAPSQGVYFSFPWTSYSTTHWAYWVRKAVEYGVAHHTGDTELQGTIWYITDRAGLYKDYPILAAIGYPPDGPRKNIGTDVAPGKVTGLKATPIAGQGIKLEWTCPTDTDTRGVLITYRSGSVAPTSPNDEYGTTLINKLGGPGQADSTIHKTATPGKTYTYAVFAYDETTHYAVASTVSAKMPGAVWLTYNNGAKDWELYQ